METKEWSNFKIRGIGQLNAAQHRIFAIAAIQLRGNL